MFLRISISRTQAVAVVASVALLSGLAAAPAQAATLGEDPNFQAAQAAITKLSDALATSCAFTADVVGQATYSGNGVLIEGSMSTDGVSRTRNEVKSYVVQNGTLTPYTDPAEGMVNAEAFYSAGKYILNDTDRDWKGYSLASILTFLGGTGTDYYESTTAPTGFSSLVPAQVCASMRSAYQRLVDVFALVRELPSTDVQVSVFDVAQTPARKRYEFFQSANGSDSRITIVEDETGMARSIGSDTNVQGSILSTGISFRELGAEVVVPPVPSAHVYTIAELNAGRVKIELNGRFVALPNKVAKAAIKAAKSAKGSAKNKVTANLIRKNAALQIKYWPGVKMKNIVGGSKFYMTKSGVTLGFCVTASGATANVAVC